jgi:hypothetical protein
LTPAEIANRAAVKDEELSAIFAAVEPPPVMKPVHIAVLGCGDRRLVAHHRMMFEKHMRRPVEITTFDITIEHLEGESGVVRHDCATPLPNPPYDITYAHVLLKFIETGKQWDVIKNSCKVLRPGGLAIHVLDRIDYETKEVRLKDGLYAVPLGDHIRQLTDHGYKFHLIPLKYGQALVIRC